MDLQETQKKYPEFIYESFDWKIDGGDLAANFCFSMGEIRFYPGIIVRGINPAQIEKIGKIGITNLVFNMGLAEIPSYWKAACPPEIVIKAGYLDKEQISFWQDLILNMRQFFYENKMPLIKPEFKIIFVDPKANPAVNNEFAPRYLVPLGGGKDSLVTLEILRQLENEVATFTLNANAPLKNVAKIADAGNIFVERKIDKKLVELNALGYFNGHTPFSSILAVLGVGLAVMFDFKYIAISQERSSDEGNVRYLGKDINHQYSKTFRFENKFREYSKKYLAKNVEYFSFLRPFYEIQISKMFVRYPKYFDSFLSCNKPFTIAAREAGIAGWCGKCSKCLSVYSMLFPFIGRERAIEIFGSDLFENEELLPAMLGLLGEGESKPMECVGTFEEMRAAFYLSFRAAAPARLYLLDYFEKNILPKYPRMDRNAAKILSSWTAKHSIPKDLAALLKAAAFGAS